MPEIVEVKLVHLLDGLLGGPMLLGDAVGGDEYAGAVVPEMAVDEDFFYRMLAEGFQELRDLIVLRRKPAAERKADKLHAEGFDALALGFDLTTLPAEIDDGGDAEFFELGEGLGFWRGAAKEKASHFAGVVYAKDGDFFRGWRGFLGACQGGLRNER